MQHKLRTTAFKLGSLVIVALSLVAAVPPAHAVYNANMSGVLEFVAAYADGDYIYLRLVNQPATHSGCNPTYFVITEEVPLERRKMLFARLMMAYAMGASVNIGYDSTGDCAHGYIRVHRVG